MPPKKKANPRGKYVIHSDHKSLPLEKAIMYYISFDPGEFNFDIRVEKRVSKEKNDYCSSIKTISQARYEIDYQRKKNGAGSNSRATLEVFEILNNYTKYFKKVDIVLIEGQMESNRPMMHIQHTLICYFLAQYPEITVIEISSKLKGKCLGAPKDLTRHFLKKWSIEMGMKLAVARNDTKFINYIEEQTEGKKKSEIKIDDDFDNYTQIEAFCVQAGYRLTKMEDD